MVSLTVRVFLFRFEEGSIKDKDKLRAREFVKEEDEKEKEREGTALLGLIRDSSTNNNYEKGPSITIEANISLADNARVAYNYISTNKSEQRESYIKERKERLFAKK